MSTFLFDQIIFGPVKSRRLGVSLGVNLLPLDSKLCNFNCIYCECGWNRDHRGVAPRFNPRAEIRHALEHKLLEMQHAKELPDAITFSGNGEPTMHPDFHNIVDDVLALRNQYAPAAQLCVLSNATMVHRPLVLQALLKVDRALLKLDSAIDATVQLIDQPQGNYSVRQTIDKMKEFKGNMILQTMFLRGNYEGTPVDNTTKVELEAWIAAIEEIHPKEVSIYSIDRDTPSPTLEKVPREELEAIANQVRELGYKVQVSG